MPGSIQEQKELLRQQLKTLRRAEQDTTAKSESVFKQLFSLEQVKTSGTILFYVSVRDELPTHVAIQQELATDRKVIVPYCCGEILKMVHLQSFEELQQGAFGILEPNETIKLDKSRTVSPSEISVALIPGLGFDRQGGRIGFGKGYYDRLLADLSSNCLRIGLAYNCQIVPSIPKAGHDKSVDMIITESEIIVVSNSSVK